MEQTQNDQDKAGQDHSSKQDAHGKSELETCRSQDSYLSS